MNFPALADRASVPGKDYASVTIRNLGADPGYVYYPYQLLSTPEEISGGQFVHDAYLAREEGVWTHTLYVQPECDPLSGAQLPGRSSGTPSRNTPASSIKTTPACRTH